MEEQKFPQNLTPFAILAGALLIAGAILYAGGVDLAPRGTADLSPPEEAQASQPDAAGEPFVGSQDAPLTLFYWSDFQCFYCKNFEQETLPFLVKEYVDTGKLRIVFKDLQFLGLGSFVAGLASKAVWETTPERYLEWHEAMFAKQGAENGGWSSREDILAITEELGIDKERIGRLMEEKEAEYGAEQEEDQKEAQRFGITGAPGFILGSSEISGARPLAEFQAAIEAELKGKE